MHFILASSILGLLYSLLTDSFDSFIPFINGLIIGFLCGVGVAWNLLDFGVSYFRAKQLSDQKLIAEERRRKALQTFIGHAGPVTALRFSSDGQLLASGAQDTSVLVWDLSTLPR